MFLATEVLLPCFVIFFGQLKIENCIHFSDTACIMPLQHENMYHSIFSYPLGPHC